MKRSDQSKYLEEFNRCIDHAIKECSRATGITDVETVDRYLRKSASVAYKRVSIILAAEQRRIRIQKRLKHCSVSVQEAAENAARGAAQKEFDFFEMEQFRGLNSRITFPERVGNAVEIRYVEYHRSTEAQRLASIEHLGKGIEADIARRDAEIAANRFLQPLVIKWGDLAPEELMRRWLDQQAEGHG